MPPVPNNLQRIRPIPDWAKSIPQEIMTSPFHLVRGCEVEWVNSLRFSTQCEFSGQRRQIVLDWSQVETILRVFKIKRHYGFDREYTNVDRIAVQLWKILSWQHAANGDWILSEFFFKRYDLSREKIGGDQTFPVEPGCSEDDKALVKFICHFLIAHEMAHIWLHESDDAGTRMGRALSHLDKIMHAGADAQEIMQQVCFGARGQPESGRRLGVKDLVEHRPDLAEELMADNMAHWCTCSLGRYGLDETTRGHLVGAVVGVEAAFGMLRDLRRPDLDDSARRMIEVYADWRLRATCGVRAAAIEEVLRLVPLWVINRFWFAFAPMFWMPTPNSDIFIEAYLASYRELEHTAGVIVGSTYFLSSVMATEDELEAALKDVPVDQRIDHRRRLREV